MTKTIRLLTFDHNDTIHLLVNRVKGNQISPINSESLNDQCGLYRYNTRPIFPLLSSTHGATVC